MRKLICAAIPALALCAAVGCIPKGADKNATPAGAVPVELREVGYDGLDAALKQHKGNVVLVDFWATWCGPCVRDFPHLVERHNKYADKGLVCISVSMDKLWPRGGYSKDRVLKFLEEQGATFPNFVAMSDEEKIEERFGQMAGIPHAALFDKSGKRVWDSGEDRISDRALDKLIESELAK